MIKASAPGNIFFFGEHAVVYNRPSINVAINKRTYTTTEKRKDKKVLVKSDVFGEAIARVSNKLIYKSIERKELEPILDLLNYFIKKFYIKTGFNLEIKSEIPVKSGLSSSSAVLCSVLKSLSELFDISINKNDYWNYLYRFQKKIHGGKASGSEIISSSLGGFNKIQKIKRGGKEKIIWKHLGKHKYSVVIGDTKVPAPTALTVGYHIPSLINRNPKFVWATFDEIASLTKKAEQTILKDDVEKLGKLMNENQNLLRNLGLSHPKLDECINVALKSGALGAKLSGSGWGGVMFALVHSKDKEGVFNAIRETGANAMLTEIGVEGIRIENK